MRINHLLQMLPTIHLIYDSPSVHTPIFKQIITFNVRTTPFNNQHSKLRRYLPNATDRYQACFRANSVDRFKNTCLLSISLSCKSFKTSPCVELIIASLLTVSIVWSKTSYVILVSERISDNVPILSRRSAICLREEI